MLEDKVRVTIEAIRPAIQADGGDIFLKGIDLDTGVVTVELTGACVSCPASTVTMKAGVERIIKECNEAGADNVLLVCNRGPMLPP